MTLESFLIIAGALHFAILIASALVPQVLDWQRELAQLSTLSRQLVWVHGAFIVLVIAGFGVLTLLNAPALAAGSPLARSVCGFIAVFWTARLTLQFFLFDPTPYIKHRLLRFGHHALTLAFVCFATIYWWAALWPEGG